MLAAAALQSEPAPPLAAEAACRAEAEPFFERARARRADGQAARDSLLGVLDGLDRRHRRGDTDCAALLWQQRVILEMLSDRHDRVIDAVTRGLDTPAATRLPDVTARLFSNRAYAYYAIGETAEASEDTYRSAALAPRLRAPTAAASLAEAAESAAIAHDWAAADAYVATARRILRDSLPAQPDLALRLGRLEAADAGLIARRLRAEAEPAARRRLARRMASAAAAARDLLTAHRSDDPVQQLYDQGDLALAHADGAHAAVLLGRAAASRQLLARARALLTADVADHYPGAALQAASTGWAVEALLGDTTSAVETATRARFAAADLGEIDAEAMALEALGSFAEARRDWDEAEQRYDEAVRLRDVQWHRTRLQDWSAAAFADAQAPYRGLARVYARTGRASEALSVLDGSRARALRDLRAEMERRDALSPARRMEADSLLEEAQRLRIDAHGNRAGQAAATARLSEIQRRVAELTGADDAAPAPLDLEALQASLRATDRVLVSYLVGQQETTAFVVTPDGVTSHGLAVGAAGIQRALAQAGGPWAQDGDAALRLDPLHALYQALVAPLRLPDGVGLVVVPDGPLHDLPFGMLVEAPAETYATAPFVIRSRPVSVELAAALAAASPAPQADGRTLVAFGRSRFGTAPSQWRGRGEALADLPNVSREIARVSEHARRARAAVDDEATEARLDGWLADAAVVHLASHAQPNPAAPARSRIFLWDDPDAPDDGVLHLYELQARRLRADLVVLSGCETARGLAQPGEGTISLQYGVRAAGAQAAVATLWAVDDRAMADVMDDFYRALADGLPKDRALQRAQVAYLDRSAGLAASPFYWGALVLSGNAAPVDLRGGGRLPWAAGGGLVVAALAWALSRRRHARLADATL